MAIVLKDRVKETSTTTGTGAITLLGAVEGYQAFSAIGDGNTTYYAIYNAEDGSWEVGTGTYTASGTTLSRDTVFESSNAGSLVNFGAGTKDVFVTYPAERAIYEEPTGNTLIDGGPITVIGSGVSPGSYTTFSAALGEMYGNVNNYAQLYVQNLNNGTDASSDFAAYNDQSDGETFFVDMGVSSSNASPAGYELLTPNSSYLLGYGDGGSNNSDMFVGSGDGNVNLFAGGFTNADIAVTIDKTTKGVDVAADLNVGGALDVTGAASFGSTVLLDADPTLALQAATKQYVDNAVSNGFHVHTPVLVATTANLTASYNNGTSGVGATLTNSGTQVALEIDGVAMSTNDRVLVWSQSTQAQNGVYVVTTVGDGSTNWVLTRATDADTYAPQSDTGLGGGDYFFVESGSTYGFSSFVCTNDGTITFGTTAITFQLFSTVPSYNVTAPLNLTGNTLSLTGTVAATNGGTGTATVTTGDLLYGSGTNTWGKLSAGSAYKSLVMNGTGTNVEWNAVALNQSGAVSGALGATNGGTGQSGYTVGDMLYSGVTNELAKLAGNTTTTKKFLTQTGTGSGSAAPDWGTIAGSDVSGAVSSATNVAGGAANQIVYQTGSGATAFTTAPTSSGTALTWNGSAFTWQSAGGATITNDTTTNTTYYPVWANATSGTMTNAYVSSGKLGFNPSTGVLSATGFSGPLTGNVTGNVSGSAGSAATATNLSTTRTDWSTNGTITAVVGQLGWKNYGNNHTIFDASNSTSPSGTSVSNTNPDAAWTGTYPTLMGWNGSSTYGVRVDRARLADGALGSYTYTQYSMGGAGSMTVSAPSGYRYAAFTSWTICARADEMPYAGSVAADGSTVTANVRSTGCSGGKYFVVIWVTAR
jgi:hypothetical protein